MFWILQAIYFAAESDTVMKEWIVAINDAFSKLRPEKVRRLVTILCHCVAHYGMDSFYAEQWSI